MYVSPSIMLLVAVLALWMRLGQPTIGGTSPLTMIVLTSAVWWMLFTPTGQHYAHALWSWLQGAPSAPSISF